MKRVPILDGEGLQLAKASEASGIPVETLRRWCIKYGIGDQWEAGGRWRVSIPAIRMVVKGAWGALELFREGAREENEFVRPFLMGNVVELGGVFEPGVAAR
jgi:hypothetical protein